MAQVFTDSIRVRLFEEVEEGNCSGLRKVPGAPGLQWSLHVVPFFKDDCVNHIGAYIKVVGGDATVTGTFITVDHYDKSDYDSGETETFKFEFKDGEKHGIDHLMDGNYKLSVEVTCNATFTLPPPNTLAPVMIHEFFDPSNENFFDTVIKVEEKEIKVHRGILSVISPVFKAMFAPNTEQTKTGIIEVADFTYETVKNAVDYCYGHNVEQKTTLEINDMICFYEKFNIQAPIEKLQTWLKEKTAAKAVKPAEKSSVDSDESDGEPTEKSDGETAKPVKKPTVQPGKRAKKSARFAEQAKRTKK